MVKRNNPGNLCATGGSGGEISCWCGSEREPEQEPVVLLTFRQIDPLEVSVCIVFVRHTSYPLRRIERSV